MLFETAIGILLDAKARGLIPSVKPLLNDLTDLGFRLSLSTRAAVLKLANES
jgi:predicted nucleic acid-binding protein